MHLKVVCTFLLSFRLIVRTVRHAQTPTVYGSCSPVGILKNMTNAVLSSAFALIVQLLYKDYDTFGKKNIW